MRSLSMKHKYIHETRLTKWKNTNNIRIEYNNFFFDIKKINNLQYFEWRENWDKMC